MACEFCCTFIFPSKTTKTFNHSKYRDSVVTYGFHTTFRPCLFFKSSRVAPKGHSDEVIESALAHKIDNKIKLTYKRKKVSLAHLES